MSMPRLVRTLGLIVLVTVDTVTAAPLARGQELQQPRTIEIVPLAPNASEINGLSITPDGEYLLSQGLIGSARDGRARLWQVSTGRLLRVIGGNDDASMPVAGLHALPGGRALAASSEAPLGVASRRPQIDPQISTFSPTQLLERSHQSLHPGLLLRVGVANWHQNRDVAYRLLRARREWQSDRCATGKSDEVTPSHAIKSE